MGWISWKSADSLERQPLTGSDAPKDTYNIAYFIFFLLGAGLLLPWNTYVSAIDYFDYLYPNTHIDRVFSLSYFIPCLVVLSLLTAYGRHYGAAGRINMGLTVFLLTVVLVPVMDEVFIKGDVGTRFTHYVTVGALLFVGIADALVQGSLYGCAGELPERYMQALTAGTAACGVLVSLLRIITKVALPQTSSGLRLSANIYFSVSAVCLAICIVSYNLLYKLPVIQHYRTLKMGAMESSHLSNGNANNYRESTLKNGNPEASEIALVTNGDSLLTNFVEPVSYWQVWRQIQWLSVSLALIYVVTMAIFPGYITEDVHSAYFGDWYPILLIGSYNVGDLIGKSMTAVYLLESQSVMIGGCFARLLFFPLFFLCLHGPVVFRTEVPVFILTLLLGVTNGYLTSNLFISAPKSVSLLESETAGIIMVVFLVIGLASGSLVSWVWII